jgi:hypothetical protein
LVAVAPHHHRIEVAKDLAKIDRGILNDPVIFPLGTGNKSIQTGSNAIDKLSHAESSLPFANLKSPAAMMARSQFARNKGSTPDPVR